MEDVGKVPAEVSPAFAEPATIGTLDGWIEALMSCKQLSELDVQRLCDKVRLFSCRYWGSMIARHPLPMLFTIPIPIPTIAFIFVFFA